MDAFFPSILLTYLEPFRQLFSQPTYAYFKAFIWAMMIIEGKKTTTNIAHACFFLKKHIASFERFLAEYIWDMNKVSQTLVNILLKVLAKKLFIYDAFLLALDTTNTPKATKKMVGTQKWKDHSGNPDHGEYIIGHQWAIAGLVSRFANRFLCWPILTRMISGKKNPSHYVCSPEGLRPMTFWDSALAIILQARAFLEPIKAIPLRVVVDAYFANASFINPMIDEGIYVITRWRKDGVGRDDPIPHIGKRNVGRPKEYGIEYKLASLLKTFTPENVMVYTYGKLSLVSVVTRDMWLRDIKKKVRVVVIEGISEPIILLSTDMTLSAAEIIEIYSSRFSIEIAIRELKQHFGFGDYQCTTPISIFRFVQLSCVSLCLWRLMLLPQNISNWLTPNFSYTKSGMNETEFSFTRVRRGLRRFVLKRIIFRNSADSAELEKLEQEYEPVFRIAA
jgi:hypothetical protein